MILFSIIIPTYKRASKIKQCLLQLVEQSFNNFEIVIVEDEECNEEIIDIFKLKLSINYIFLKTKKNVSEKRNLGAKKAIGKYLIFLDDDDIVEKNWLNDFSIPLMQSSFSIVFCAVLYSNNNKVILPQNAYSDGRGSGIFLAGCFAVDALIFNKIDGYDEMLIYGENTELGMRLKPEIKTISYINKPNLIYQNSNSTSTIKLENIIKSNNHIIQKHLNYFEQNTTLYFNYLSVMGISSYKLNNIKEAQIYLAKALQIKKTNVKAIGRYLLSKMPFLAKKLW